jgi:hypothetical protein
VHVGGAFGGTEPALSPAAARAHEKRGKGQAGDIGEAPPQKRRLVEAAGTG